MYDSHGFFSENAIGRYAIGDRDGLRYNADGSLDTYVQHSRPGTEKESNWLPAPAEPFSMTLRCIGPSRRRSTTRGHRRRRFAQSSETFTQWEKRRQTP